MKLQCNTINYYGLDRLLVCFGGWEGESMGYYTQWYRMIQSGYQDLKDKRHWEPICTIHVYYRKAENLIMNLQAQSFENMLCFRYQGWIKGCFLFCSSMTCHLNLKSSIIRECRGVKYEFYMPHTDTLTRLWFG